MAIEKTLINGNTGEEYTHQQITTITIFPVEQKTVVRLAYFVNADIAEFGGKESDGSEYTFAGVPNGDPVAWAEAKILARPEWKGNPITIS